MLNYIFIVAMFYWVLQQQSINFIYFIFGGIPMLECINYSLLPFPLMLSPRPSKRVDDVCYGFGMYAMQVFMFWVFLSTKQITFTDSVSMGLMMALGINVAHELIHKTSSFDKWCGRRLLEFSGYGFVGFVNDPATAPSQPTDSLWAANCKNYDASTSSSDYIYI